MSAKDSAVTIGGEPRIDFLPPEIRQKKQARRKVRGLILLAVVVLGVCVAAYVGVTTLALASQVNLEAEQARTQALLQEQGEYSEARSVSMTLEAAKSARLVASANEVLWQPYFTEASAVLPAEGIITAVTVDSLNTTEAPPVPKEGVESPRKGTIVFGASFESLSGIATWLENVEELPGFVGYSISEAALDEAGRYDIKLSLNIDDGAHELRFFEDIADSDDESTDEETQE